MRKRVDKIDWLANKEKYLKLIEKTPNDSLFILTLQNIIKDLNDGHVSMNATRYGHEGYSEAYKRLAAENANYNTWVNVFQKSGKQIDYWATILKNSEPKITSKSKSISKPQKITSNYSDTIVSDGLIAIMTIRSFNLFKINDDKIRIDHFLNSIENGKYLIIDIQENSGGAVKYWKENLVERLINDTVYYTQYPIIKDGFLNRLFYPDFFKEAHFLQKTDILNAVPEEFLNEKYYIKQEIDTITPNNSINFKGKIYLLVSKTVFSSSEGFAQFCKTTKWATIVGERTGGDGVGSDPALILLPESKIIIGYPSLIGLNHDGSLNAEERTKPDIETTEKTYQNRLYWLIEYIKNNNNNYR